MLEHHCVHVLGSVLVIVRFTERPRSEFSFVPMGHFCPTAGFLQQAGWRYQALPLDWSRATFKVWQHMLRDNFETLLRPMDAYGGPHPYNIMFWDVEMFVHDGGWASGKMQRRTARLRSILEEGRAFGLAFYFEGAQNMQTSFDEIVADACDLMALGCGLCHIVLVWFKRPPCCSPAAVWSVVGDHVSILQYATASRALNRWGNSLPQTQDKLLPETTVHIAQLLEDRFPNVFTRYGGGGQDEHSKHLGAVKGVDFYDGSDWGWDEFRHEPRE